MISLSNMKRSALRFCWILVLSVVLQTSAQPTGSSGSRVRQSNGVTIELHLLSTLTANHDPCQNNLCSVRETCTALSNPALLFPAAVCTANQSLANEGDDYPIYATGLVCRNVSLGGNPFDCNTRAELETMAEEQCTSSEFVAGLQIIQPCLTFDGSSSSSYLFANFQCCQRGAQFIQPTFSCSNLTSPHCGDGVLDEGEVCDDGNDDDADGCSSNCVELCPNSTTTITTATLSPTSPEGSADGSGTSPSVETTLVTSSPAITSNHDGTTTDKDGSSPTEIAKKRRRRAACMCDETTLSEVRKESTSVSAIGYRNSGTKEKDFPTLAKIPNDFFHPGNLALIRRSICQGRKLPSNDDNRSQLDRDLLSGLSNALPPDEKKAINDRCAGTTLWMRISAECCTSIRIGLRCEGYQRRFYSWERKHNLLVRCVPVRRTLKLNDALDDSDLHRLRRDCFEKAVKHFSCREKRVRKIPVRL